METIRKKKIFPVEPLAAFLLSAGFFLLILCRFRILPFGSKTLLFSDLDSQYVEFMAEYRRILLGQGSLAYSWHAGLGMNFLAVIAYYLASPFNFLLVFFPESSLPLAISIITTLKLGCSGAAFAVFLQHINEDRRTFIPAFSLCYALSAYALGYAFNIMWLDALIWLPLLCLEIDHMLDTPNRGMTGLTLLFALSFLSQFYMSWMTGLFCALYFLAKTIIQKTPFWIFVRNTLRFAICVGIAAGLSAFLLLPTFLVLKNNMGLLGQEIPAFTGAFPFQNLLKMLFAGSFDWIKDSLPHIYAGLPMLIGLILYFLSKNVSAREKIVSGTLGCLLLFSFWFRPLDFLWHAMDHPSWFPFRYAFVFVFWGLVCAYKGFSLTSGANKKNLFAYAICFGLLLASYFSSGFSEHGYLFFNAVFLLLYASAAFPVSVRAQTTLFMLICAAELFLNGCLIIEKFSDHYTSLENYQEFHEHYHDLTEPLLPSGTDFYRMEKTEKRNYNDPLGIGFPGVSHFSSTASTRQSEYLKRLGFNCYATWCTYEGSTIVTDAILRIRYEFGKSGKTDSISVRDQTWQHPSQFPLFFFAEDRYARYDFFQDDVEPLARQEDLLQLLSSEEETPFFEKIPLKITAVENLIKADNGTYYRQDPQQKAYVELEINTSPKESSYLYLSDASLNYNVYTGDIRLMNGYSDYASFPICLDAFANKGIVQIRIETITDSLSTRIYALSIDPERLASLSKQMNQAAPQIEWISETEFILNTELSDQERLIVSSIPFDAGWHVTANNKDLPLKMIHNSVLGFILPAGCETVTVSYEPYGARMGQILSICAFTAWIAVLLFEMRKKVDKK